MFAYIAAVMVVNMSHHQTIKTYTPQKLRSAQRRHSHTSTLHARACDLRLKTG